VIAWRSRGTLRIVNRLLQRARDYAQVRAAGRIDVDVAAAALDVLGIDSIGLDELDRRHNLLNIKFHAETRVDPARLMNIVAKTRGAQFTPAGVLLLPLDGQTGAGDILRFLSEKLEQLRGGG